jgi:hypothetical protein
LCLYIVAACVVQHVIHRRQRARQAHHGWWAHYRTKPQLEYSSTLACSVLAVFAITFCSALRVYSEDDASIDGNFLNVLHHALYLLIFTCIAAGKSGKIQTGKNTTRHLQGV